MLIPTRFKISVGLLYCAFAVGFSMPAHSQRVPHGPLILSTNRYQPGAFPYVVRELPRGNWLGFAYNPLGTNPISCKLLRTSISIKHEETGERDGPADNWQSEVVTYVAANSGTPKPDYLIHGLDLSPGPFDCIRLQRRFSVIATNSPFLGETPQVVATFRFRKQTGTISLNRLNGSAYLTMRYGGRTQTLESAPRSLLVLDVEMIGDLDRDGNPDVIVSEGGGAGEPASHMKLYLSSKAAAGQLVGEAASY